MHSTLQVASEDFPNIFALGMLLLFFNELKEDEDDKEDEADETKKTKMMKMKMIYLR